MNRLSILKSLLFFFILQLNFGSFALEPPILKYRVNDFAGVLQAQTTESIVYKLLELEHNSSLKLTILIVPSLEGETIENFALKTFDGWKLEKTNSRREILLVLALKEHKAWVEFDKALEEILPDKVTKHIIENNIALLFKTDFLMKVFLKVLILLLL